MGLSIALCDSQTKALAEFKAMVEKLNPDISILKYSSSVHLIEDFQQHPTSIDVICLGHGLSRLAVLSLSDQLLAIRSSIQLVRVYETKEDNPLLFVKDEQTLHYPFQVDEVASLIQHVQYNLFMERRRKLMVYATDGYHQLYLRDISYIEQVRQHVVIHQPGQADIKLDNYIDEVVHLLKGEPFIQCSPYSLVNMYHVTQYTPAYFYILNKKIRIAEELRPECKVLYQRHMDKIRTR